MALVIAFDLAGAGLGLGPEARRFCGGRADVAPALFADGLLVLSWRIRVAKRRGHAPSFGVLDYLVPIIYLAVALLLGPGVLLRKPEGT